MTSRHLPEEHAAARRYASSLVMEAQSDAEWVADAILVARGEAQRRGWDDIDLALIHAAVVHSGQHRVGSTSELLDELEAGAERIGSNGLKAIAVVDRIHYLRHLSGRAPIHLYATARILLSHSSATPDDRFSGLVNLANELETIGLSRLGDAVLSDAADVTDLLDDPTVPRSVLAHNHTHQLLRQASDRVMEGDMDLAGGCLAASDERAALVENVIPAGWIARMAVHRRTISALVDHEDVAAVEADRLTGRLDAVDVERAGLLRLLTPLHTQTTVPTADELDTFDQRQFGWFLRVRSLQRSETTPTPDLVAAFEGYNRSLVDRSARARFEMERGVAAMIEAESLGRERGELALQVVTDPLTLLGNRRAWQRGLDDHRERIATVVLLDLDRFKLVNDTHGHIVGDVVLQRLSTLLADVAAAYEPVVVARLGGDEFGVLLSGSRRQDAESLVEELHVAMRTADWPTELTTSQTFTAGIGVADSSDELVTSADRELYSGKRARRSRSDDRAD